MISELAESDIKRMQDDGLSPSVPDIIRLNAMGVKIERAQRSGDFFALPRVSFLGKSEVFREPSIGHISWIDTVLQYVDWKDYSTYIAVYAYAISRGVHELPDAMKRDECVKAIDDYTKTNLSVFTFRQINAAILYATKGSDAVANEYPPDEKESDETEEPKGEDELRSIGVGIMLQAAAMGLGLSLRDISMLTLSQVEKLKAVAFKSKGIDVDKHAVSHAQRDYYRTLDEIRERLISEKEAGNGKQ